MGILECGVNLGHEYYFLAYGFSTLLVEVFHVYPTYCEANVSLKILCVTCNKQKIYI